MKKEIIKIEDVNNKLLKDLNINEAILYYIDKIELLKNIEDVEKIKFDNLLEGILFGINNEIKIIREGNNFKAVVMNEEKEDEYIVAKHLVINERFNNVKTVEIKKYIEDDEDGQAYISYFRPFALN